MEMMDEKASHPKYWMPLVWAGAIVTRARKEKRISSDYVASQLMEKLDQFRGIHTILYEFLRFCSSSK